jgi:HEAT repeat protein
MSKNAISVNPAAVDKAFEALNTYDYGSARASLLPIDDAVRSSLGDAGARKGLERRLVAALSTKASPVAKQYVCAKLGLMGSAGAVPALAALLSEPALSHAARSALEAMPCPEAVEALRNCLPKLGGLLKVGVINSLGARRDARSMPALANLLEDADTQVVAAAATALGAIGTAGAATALRAFQPKAPEAMRLAVADACLAAAERLLANGKKAPAQAMYQALATAEQPKHVQLAAKRGLSRAAPKP